MTDHKRPTGPEPALSDQMIDAFLGPREAATLVPCPRCGECPLCDGSQMVAPAQASEYQRNSQIALDGDELDETDEETTG